MLVIYITGVNTDLWLNQSNHIDDICGFSFEAAIRDLS